jgi:hypothetical protein
MIDKVPTPKNAKMVWDKLKSEFKKTSISSIYALFVKALEHRLTGNRDPNIDLAQISDYFDKMKANKCDIPKVLRAIIILVKIPQKWSNQVSYIMSKVEKVQDLTVSLIKTSLQSEFNRPSYKNSTMQTAQRISAVSAKPKNISWQDRPQYQSNTGPARHQRQFAKSNRGKGGKRGRGNFRPFKGRKGTPYPHNHSHQANHIAYNLAVGSPSGNWSRADASNNWRHGNGKDNWRNFNNPRAMGYSTHQPTWGVPYDWNIKSDYTGWEPQPDKDMGWTRDDVEMVDSGRPEDLTRPQSRPWDYQCPVGWYQDLKPEAR